MNDKVNSNIVYINYSSSSAELGYYENSSLPNSMSNIMMNNSILIYNCSNTHK